MNPRRRRPAHPHAHAPAPSGLGPGRRAFLRASLHAAAAASLAGFTGLGAACDRRPAANAPAGLIELEFWTLALRPFEAYIRGQIAEFEATHPGVRVRWSDVPFDALDRKLVAAAAAGRSPDVINLSDKSFARYVGLGAMKDLTGLLPGDPAGTFIPGALRLANIDGQLLALPWYLTTQAVLANRALLALGGLTPQTLPDTWAGLRDAARAYAERVGPRGPRLFTVPLGHESDVPMMMLGEGLPPLKPAGAAAGAGLVPDWSRPEIVRAVGDWIALYRQGALPREAGTGGQSHLPDLYQNARVAVINSGPNFLKRIGDTYPRVFEQTDVLGPITGSLRRGHIAVMVLGVMALSRHPGPAAELAWHMARPASQEALCQLAVILPSTGASLERPEFRDGGAGRPEHEAKLLRARAITAAALRDAVAFTPALPAWPDLRRAFEERFTRALLSPGAPGDDARQTASLLARIDAEWARILSITHGNTPGAVPTPAPAAHRAARDGPDGPAGARP